LDRQFTEQKSFVPRKRLIQCLEFRQKDSVERYAVEDDVVQGEEESVFRISQADKPRPVQWTSREIERLECVFRGQANGLSFPVRLGKRAQVDERNLYARRGRVDDLDDLIAFPTEGGPPSFMAAKDFRKAAFQSQDIELATSMDRHWLVVNQRFPRQLRVKPDLLLTIRQRRRT
jgi:hypothetical protein